MRLSTRLYATTLLLGLGGTAWGLGLAVGDCDSLRAQAELIARHPEVDSACESIVAVVGRRYLLMSAEVRAIAAEQLVVRFKGAATDTVLGVGAEPPVAPDADAALPMDTAVGSPLRVFVPEDRLPEVLGAHSTDDQSPVPVAVQPADSKAAREARIANYTCCPRRRPWYPIIEVLPQTATPLPLLGLLGLGLLTVAAGLARRRTARR